MLNSKVNKGHTQGYIPNLQSLSRVPSTEMIITIPNSGVDVVDDDQQKATNRQLPPLKVARLHRE